LRASSSSTLSLAARLRSLDDAALTELLTEREVRDTRLRDFFDVADAMLDAASIQKVFTRLDRPTLTALSVIASAEGDGMPAADIIAATLPLVVGEPQLDELASLALIESTDDGWVAYSPVGDQLSEWPSLRLPSAEQLRTEPAPATLTPVSDSDVRFIDHVAGEHAFSTTNSIAELLAEIQRSPARELARGGIALPETKRLASAMSVELDAIPALVEIASRAELAALDHGEWFATAAAAEWMLRPSGERWAHLAGAWFARLPSDIRSLLAGRAHSEWGTRLTEYVIWLFPAGGEWMRDRTLAFARDAELLGITANNVPSTPGSALLTAGETQAAAGMAALFPAEIDHVYLQHDLSIVSPGPLLPRLDARLRIIADVESRALATSYRVSQSSVNRALAMGETAASIREFLSQISLTGIPQPLEYLIAGSAARFGAVRVGSIVEASSDERGARSYVTSDDASLLSAVAVDHGLAPLGITKVSPHRAISRFDSELVFWSLSDAKYPVAAEDARGTIVLLERRRVAKPAVPTPESHAVAIVRKLRLAADATAGETGQAWLERQIDMAIRAKIGLTVTVAMPDGSSVDLQLEPASVAGGRLRARDRRSDLERTLPLSSITAVAPAVPSVE
jgi:hypothetical protein